METFSELADNTNIERGIEIMKRFFTVLAVFAVSLCITLTGINHAKASLLCPDSKSGFAGCWTAPFGYVPAAKNISGLSSPVVNSVAQNTLPRGLGTINDLIPSPFSSEQYLISNEYVTLEGPLTAIYFAGFNAQNPSQGIVAELTTPTNENDQATQPTLKVFDAPGTVGKLTFTSVKGNILTIATQGASTITFDLIAHSFG